MEFFGDNVEYADHDPFPKQDETYESCKYRMQHEHSIVSLCTRSFYLYIHRSTASTQATQADIAALDARPSSALPVRALIVIPDTTDKANEAKIR